MPYSLVRFSGLRVKAILNKFEEKIKKGQKYDDILKKIFDTNIFNSDSLTRELKEKKYQIKEIIYDCFSLNELWCLENNIDLSIAKNTDKLFYIQVKKLKPEIIFFQHKPHVSSETLIEVKNEFKFIKIIAVHNGFYVNHSELKGVDLVLCAFPSYKKKYQNKIKHSFLFYHYFNTNILKKFNFDEKRKIDISFIGSSGYGLPYHYNRYFLLDFLLKNTNICCWIDENPFETNSFKNKLIKKIKKIIMMQPTVFLSKEKFINKIFHEVFEEKNILNFLNEKNIKYKLSEKFFSKCYKPVYGNEMYKILFNSKISINSHMLKSGNEHGNMRMFEATGSKSCLFVDEAENNRLFDHDKEIIIYKDKNDCLDKLNYFLKNENEAQDIANNGFNKTLLNHTAKVRADQLNQIFEKII